MTNNEDTKELLNDAVAVYDDEDNDNNENYNNENDNITGELLNDAVAVYDDDDDDDDNDNNDNDNAIYTAPFELKLRAHPVHVSTYNQKVTENDKQQQQQQQQPSTKNTTTTTDYGGNTTGTTRNNNIHHHANGTTTTTVTTTVRKTKVQIGEEMVRKLIMDAEYEVDVDPYRGLQTFLKAYNSSTDKRNSEELFDEESSMCPWIPCHVAYTDTESNNNTNTSSPSFTDSNIQQPPQQQIHQKKNEYFTGSLSSCSSVEDIVHHVCKCICPTVLDWTEKVQNEAMKKRNKRKRKIGKTEDDESDLLPFGIRDTHFLDSYRCYCDYNMFCLSSLGGVVDEMLVERYQTIMMMKKKKPPIENNSSGNDNGNAIVIDDDIHPNNTSDIEKSDQAAQNVLRRKILDYESDYYTPLTSQTLLQIRKSITISQEPIRQYLKNTLQNLKFAVSMNDLMESIRQQHKSLLFVNPLIDSSINNNYNDDDENENDICHKNMINDKKSGGMMIELSIPPGIENLGATCYLNTQLQCLAQNRVFVDGICSWRSPTPGDMMMMESNTTSTTRPGNDTNTTQQQRMNSVISLFQQLLARMNSGPNSSISTIEFSNALGLDHYEQQDPNEFSRLLLERIHDSFQGSKTELSETTTATQNDGYCLSSLLPHLFEGVIVYETTCSKCQHKSRMTEKFMDLNLPIMKMVPMNKNSGQLTIDVAFAKSTDQDTNVQYCLDEYCHAEMLDGENQYMCSICNCKQDAKRCISFQRLPPVLNIQLSRYVYDRVKMMKQKKTDKVLLPLELFVNTSNENESVQSKNNGKETTNMKQRNNNDNHDDNENQKSRYLLCAVMRHQGNSAYSGHYVAEAMDWLTGQWYEFNDAIVTLLESGPSNSYIPDEQKSHIHSKGTKEKPEVDKNGKGKGGSKSKVTTTTTTKGSQDAYNMYYVEESFLAQNVFEKLRKGKQHATSSSTTIETDQSLHVMDAVSMERSKIYMDLSQMCIDDGNISGKLSRRREVIRQKIFPDFPNIVHSSLNSNDFVWVDGYILRQFISCQRGSIPDSELVGHAQIVRSRHEVLCPHGKIHPRVARDGKLLPRSICKEYALALNHSNFGECDFTKVQRFMDNVAVEIDHIVCTTCGLQYCQELEKPLQSVRNMKFLYDAFDPKGKDFGLGLDLDFDQSFGHECDQYAYIVSRKFMTLFRNKFVSFLKKIAKKDLEISKSITGEYYQQMDKRSLAEGIDALDLTKCDMYPLQVSDALSIDSEEERNYAYVNSTITCQHGICIPSSRQCYNFVPFHTWRILKQMFPNAIEHKVKRSGVGSSLVDNEETDGRFEEDFFCIECHTKDQGEESIRSSLYAFIKHCKDTDKSFEGLTCNELIQNSSSCVERLNHFRILHKSDIQTLQRFLLAFKRKDVHHKSDSAFNVARSLLVDESSEMNCAIIFPDAGSQISTKDMKRVDLLSEILHPVICSHHDQPLFSAISCDKRSSHTDGVHSHRSFNDDVRLLDESTYRDFLAHLVAIVMILVPEDNDGDIPVVQPVHTFIDRAAKFCEKWNITRAHPKCYFPVGACDAKSKYLISDETVCTFLGLKSTPCEEVQCNVPYLERKQGSSDSQTAAMPSTTNVVTFGPMGDFQNPISIDVEANDMFPDYNIHTIRVFEVERQATSEKCVEAVKALGCTPCEDDNNNKHQALRRSKRTKKTQYPFGIILEEDNIRINFDKNLASLRLILLENCMKGSPFELNHKLFLVVSTSSDESTISLPSERDENKNSESQDSSESTSVQHVELSLDLSSQVLREVCESVLGTPLLPSFDVSRNIYLLRQSDSSNESKVPQEELMDHLLELSDNSNIQNEGNSTKVGTKRKRGIERGFQGTFLSSDSQHKTSSDSFVEPKVGCLLAAISVLESDRVCNSPNEGDCNSICVQASETSDIVEYDDNCTLHSIDDIGDTGFMEPQYKIDPFNNARDSYASVDEKQCSNSSLGQSVSSPNEKRSETILDTRNEVYVGSDSLQSIGNQIYTSVSNNDISVVDDEEDNDCTHLEISQSPQQPESRLPVYSTSNFADVSKEYDTTIVNDDIEDDDTGDSDLVFQVAQLLLKNPDIRSELQMLCWDSAFSAVNAHPDVLDPQILLDYAYDIIFTSLSEEQI